jgi:flagella basal body P-ring formation protein FlgA
MQLSDAMPSSARTTALVLVALTLSVPGARARAAEPEPLEQIARTARDAAASATGRPVAELEVAPIDPRLRRPACTAALAGRPIAGARAVAQLTIEVSCASPSWRQFVAVHVHADEPVAVAARPLSRLAVVTADDLLFVTRDVGSLPGGYFRHPEDVIGRIAQRTIGAGEVLAADVVRQPPLVHHGQAVTLVAQSGGLNVRAPGIAQADAGLAERVRVRNTVTSRMVEGVVRSAQTVEVLLE